MKCIRFLPLPPPHLSPSLFCTPSIYLSIYLPRPASPLTVESRPALDQNTSWVIVEIPPEKISLEQIV